MSKKVAFLFPGQGAQYPGMGADFFENFAEAKAIFQKADAILGEPFSKLIFGGSKEELTLTKNSQLAIFITSIAILHVLQTQLPDLEPVICAGLSLGEYTALVAAKMISFEEALLLVKARGNFMHEACETHPGVMTVVLGLELPIVQEAVAKVENVWIANLNCPGQIVVAGTHKGMEEVMALLKEKGARRILPLDVSGAFHSGLMQEAQDKLEILVHKVCLRPSRIEIVMNVTGDFVDAVEEIRSHMIEQVTHPVRWQKGIEAMEEKGVDLFIEIGPGKTLAGMNKRIGVRSPTISIEKVEDFQSLVENEPGVGHAIAQR